MRKCTQKLFLQYLMIFCIMGFGYSFAQQKFTTLIKSTLEDEIVILSIDKQVYFPGDTLRLTVQRSNSSSSVVVLPSLLIEGTELIYAGNNNYISVIPSSCVPGEYQIRLKVNDKQGKHFIYETDCSVNIEEHQIIERIDKYVRIEPETGGREAKSAVTLDRDQIHNLRVVFHRDSISLGMGPQFVTIRTTVLLRDGTTSQTFERRVLTFRSDKSPGRDRAMLIQYRRAYGPYAAIRLEEFTQVQVNVDTLPDWAIVKINIEPDYTIKIGGYDKSNSYTRYFCVRGPKIEIGLSFGIPKVLYDSQENDPINYGNYSTMLRFYYVEDASGLRFPLNLGVGTYGVDSPLDVNVGRGGFGLSVFLNVAEIIRLTLIDFGKEITAGLEFVPFFPISKRMRFLIAAQVGISF